MIKEDDGMGAYLSLGIVPFAHRQVSSVVSIGYLHRPNVFSGSDRSFDSDELMLRFSVSFH